VREADARELHQRVEIQPEAVAMGEKKGYSTVEGMCCSLVGSNNMRYNREIAAAEVVDCYGRMSVCQ